MVDINIEEQEKKDYKQTKEILEKLFGEKLIAIERLEGKTHVDCAFSGATGCILREYAMEIKESNEDYYKRFGFLLKVSKYINMFKWKKDNRNHHLFIIYLAEKDRKYYIFNVENITLGINNIRNYKLKAVEYDENSPIIDTPCIELYTNNAIINGDY